jgi:hypothetical protein
MAAAGAAAWLWPTPSLAEATAGAQVLLLIWEVFLIVGGISSAVGAFTDRWLGEYVGLPLLASTFGVYAAAAAAAGITAGRPTSTAGALALAAIAVVIVGRWLEVGLVRREALDAARERGSGHG